MTLLRRAARRRWRVLCAGQLIEAGGRVIPQFQLEIDGHQREAAQVKGFGQRRVGAALHAVDAQRVDLGGLQDGGGPFVLRQSVPQPAFQRESVAAGRHRHQAQRQADQWPLVATCGMVRAAAVTRRAAQADVEVAAEVVGRADFTGFVGGPSPDAEAVGASRREALLETGAGRQQMIAQGDEGGAESRVVHGFIRLRQR